MQLIPDTINLADFMPRPEFEAKVRPASDFLADVKLALGPKDLRPKHPTILSRKAQGLIEFRPGEITAWTGYNGHRKSMLTSQVAIELCVQRQRVLLVSLEMDPPNTMARMTRQAVASGAPSVRDIEAFHRWSDGRLWLFDHVGKLETKTAQALCRYFAQQLSGQHVFIDSMMMVCSSEEHLDEQKQFVTDLCRIAKETGLHVHLITHCRKPPSGEEGKPPSKYDIKGSGAISDQAHNVMVVWANKAKKAKLEEDPLDFKAREQPDALLSCEKQRNGEWEGRLKFWFHDPSLRFCDDYTSPVSPYALTDLG